MSVRQARGAVKLKLAIDFCRFSGVPASFRTLFPEVSKAAGGEYHNIYSAAEIRQARLTLMGTDGTPVRPRTVPPIIYVRMAKGGTGKTTVAGNVSACLALMGYKVLMIDGDPQASLTSLFGIDWTTEEITHIGHLLQANEARAPIDLRKTVKPIYADGMLDLIASDITLADIDTWLIGIMKREASFSRFLASQLDFVSRYDAIVIDSAPGTTQLSNAFMYAAKRLLAVVLLDGQSIKAMEVLASNIAEMNEAYPELGLTVRLVANGYAANINACKEALDTLRMAYPGALDPNIIPRSAAFARQVSLFDDADSGPIIENEPNSGAARVMIDLTRSLIGAYDLQLAGLMPVISPDRRSAKRRPLIAKVAA